MKILALTSSRADYGICRPLYRRLADDGAFTFELAAFGTHLSRFHGFTVDEIKQDGFEVAHRIESMVVGDTPASIATAFGLTALKFADFWREQASRVDAIFCLGDRYEMLAAVQASLPFNLPVIHYSGGETTLGAIDNVFRHCLTHCARVHFVSAEPYAERVRQMTGSRHQVFNVGALGLDNLHEIPRHTLADFERRFGVNLGKPTILFTFHPETVSYERNAEHIQEIIAALETLRGTHQLLVTMPNADTMSGLIRESLHAFAARHPNVFPVESLGTAGYFTALESCEFVMGNSSSGIVEAASFRKYVLNLGDRQTGRIHGPNVLDVPIERTAIQVAADSIRTRLPLDGSNPYGDGHASEKIVSHLKSIDFEKELR